MDGPAANAGATAARLGANANRIVRSLISMFNCRGSSRGSDGIPVSDPRPVIATSAARECATLIGSPCQCTRSAQMTDFSDLRLDRAESPKTPDEQQGPQLPLVMTIVAV